LPALEKLQARVSALEAEVREMLSGRAHDVVGEVASAAEDAGGVRVVGAKVAARNAEHLVSLVDQVRDRLTPAVVILAAEVEGKALFVASASKGVSGVNAGELIKQAASVAGGAGGGSATLGRGGGGDPSKLEAALERSRTVALDSLRAG
jgi:alanyl-tRNA synthetase